MKKPLHAFFLIILFSITSYHYQAVAQGTSRVDVGKSFANLSKLSGGGTFSPGDTVEIRVTIAVIRQVTYTAIDSVQVFDVVPLKTTYIPGSMRIATNQGVTYKGPFTEVVDADQGSNVGGNITINLGNKANGVKGGRIRSDTSKPSFFNSHCIMMACYRVRINPGANFGDTIFIGGRVRYKMVTPANGWSNINFPIYQMLLFPYNGYCNNGTTMSAASDSSGTFASGAQQNRPAALAFGTTYIKQNISTGQPNDYNYAIVNNSSADGWTNPNSTMPESPAAHRVFGYWDIAGDHTGSSNPTFGNPPVAPGVRSGYMVLVNASYNTDIAYKETISNLCPNTYYEFSAWFRNVCPRCSCDSNGRGSGTPGFIPYPGNDSSGVRPNLTFEIDNLAYYTTGDMKYDRARPWKQYGFTFLTKPSQTSATFTIRNNSPGGGGNDWVMDDIKIAHCGPTMKMNYNPMVLGCKESPFQVNLIDTIRFSYNNSYIHFQWQKSNVGGTVWSNMTGPGTSGIGSPVLINGQYEYVTQLPPFMAGPADSGTYYRVIVATTAASLRDPACAFIDGNKTMVSVITCGVVLPTEVIVFKGQLNNDQAHLNWTSVNEIELDHYDLEKSYDGISFFKTTQIAARNLPNATYQYIDPEKIQGMVYYRLRINGRNDLFKYSQVIMVSKILFYEFRIVQNPFSDQLAAVVIVPVDGQLTVKLFNNIGIMVKTEMIPVKKGMNNITLSGLERLYSGAYFITSTFNKEMIKRKVVKIR